MRYRTSLGISADIFSHLQDSGARGLRVTVLLQKSGLNFKAMKTILARLVEADLVEEIESSYVLTSKGLLYSKKLEEFSDFTESFGMKL